MVEHPFIYEINTWVWLAEVGCRLGTSVDLASVPAEEWDAIAELGFDAVWLMGVWERSPAGIAVALRDEALIGSFREALPDMADADVVGSPYCVRDYVVAEQLGGPDALAAARLELARRDLGLLLDFVPNHVAPDHRWTSEHPEYFILGSDDDLARDPASFMRVGGRVLANGRDPYFPAWPDVVQLNAFSPALREAVVGTLARVAEQCDGVRCDMAMLVMNDVFAQTWSGRAGSAPREDYWAAVIPDVRRRSPEFVFLAEAYWDREYALQQQGFDYCYDKRLYDRLEGEGAEAVHGHLTADAAYQNRLMRFIENHDEPRAAATFPPAKAEAAAVTALTVRGARLVHDGQLDGRRTHLPVFLGRHPHEDHDQKLRSFYELLLNALRDEVFRTGEWQLAQRRACAGNEAWPNLIAWGWRDDLPRKLVIVNYGAAPAAGLVSLPWDDLRGRSWQLEDASNGEVYVREGDELRDGLHVARDAWGWHLFDLTPSTGEIPGRAHA